MEMNFMQDPIKKKQFFYTYGIFVMNGILALSIGALLPFIRESRGLSYAFIGLLVSLHSVGNLFSSFTAGILPLYLGRKKSILLFNASFFLAYLLIVLSPSNLALSLAFILTGMARGATSNFCNQVVNNLATGKAWIFSGLHAMFAIGAFTFPLVVMGITAADSSRWVFALYLLMGIGALNWLLYYLMPLEDDRIQKKTEKGNFSFFKEPLFWLVTLTLFFYLGAEQGVIGWLVTYFVSTGLLSETLSQVMASVLWIMILVGRLGTAYLTKKVSPRKLLLAMGSGLIVFFLLLITSESPAFIVLGIAGFGLSMAGVYPTVVSFAGGLIQKHALSWSFMLTGAALGAILMPALIGAIAEGAGIVYGMSSVGGAVMLNFIFILALLNYVKKL